MRKRLRKEFHLVALPLLGAVAATAVALEFDDLNRHTFLGFAGIVEYLVLCYMSVSIFAAEFRHGTMAGLLSQPIPRIRIWREKMAVLSGTFLVVLCFCVLVSLPSMVRTAGFDPDVWTLLRELTRLFPFLNVFLGLALVAFGSGPMAALYLGRSHVALWAAWVFPLFLFLFGIFFDAILIKPLFYASQIELIFETNFFGLINAGLLLALLFCVCCHALARRRFLNLEV